MLQLYSCELVLLFAPAPAATRDGQSARARAPLRRGGNAPPSRQNAVFGYSRTFPYVPVGAGRYHVCAICGIVAHVNALTRLPFVCA